MVNTVALSDSQRDRPRCVGRACHPSRRCTRAKSMRFARSCARLVRADTCVVRSFQDLLGRATWTSLAGPPHGGGQPLVRPESGNGSAPVVVYKWV